MTSPAAEAALAEELERIHASYRAPSKGRRAVDTWTMLLRNRRASLRRLVAYRRLHNLPMGPEPGWVAMILNLLHLEAAPTDEVEVGQLAQWLGLDVSPSVVAATPGIFGRRLLRDGALLMLRAVEREGARIRDIDACDETPDDRRRRKQADRQRKRRGPAMPKPVQPWVALRMSRAKWYRLGKPSAGS